jgi:hypothetical protein
MRSIRYAIFAPVSLALLALVGCGGGYSANEGVVVNEGVIHEGGPPPHAPAYGYRYHHPHDHVLLIYEPDLALYRVSGYRSYYFRDGTYYRLRSGSWYRASRIHGNWAAVNYQSIPSGLQHKYKAPKEAKSKPPGMHAKKHYKRGKGHQDGDHP